MAETDKKVENKKPKKPNISKGSLPPKWSAAYKALILIGKIKE
jgi:hypothetical protein